MLHIVDSIPMQRLLRGSPRLEKLFEQVLWVRIGPDRAVQMWVVQVERDVPPMTPARIPRQNGPDASAG